MSLSGKNIVLGVTGSIAACKAADLTSQLRKAGADVHVVMTHEALEFVGELTFKTLSRNPVITSLSSEKNSWQPGHIELADHCDLLLIAPATANTISKLALGLADDALTSIALACQAPLLIAPAMNGKMWEHPAIRHNVKTLSDRGARFIGPEEGMLACGYEGLGRLQPIESILETCSEILS
ncbi:MAG: flavoprotein [Chthoniobacterales bacterium]